MTSGPPGWSMPDPGQVPYPPPAAPPPGWGAAPGWGAPGWSPAPPPPPEVRPGVVPLRPLGVGELIDGAISTMRRHWKVMLGLSAVVVTAVSVLQAGALYLLFRNTAGLESGDTLTGPDADAGLAANAAQVVTLAIGQLAQIVLLGILTVVVSRAVLGEDVTAGQAWAAVRPRLWRLIVLSLAVLLGALALVLVPVLAGVLVDVAGAPTAGTVAVIVLGELVAVPAAVWLYVKLGVAAPALILEKSTISTAFRRSFRLVRRGWWRVFGILLLATFMAGFLSGIIQVPFTVGAVVSDLRSDRLTPGVLFYVLTTLGASVAGTITYPFTAGVAALLYIDLRMRREGLDLALVRAAGVPATSPPAAPPAAPPAPAPNPSWQGPPGPGSWSASG